MDGADPSKVKSLGWEVVGYSVQTVNHCKSLGISIEEYARKHAKETLTGRPFSLHEAALQFQALAEKAGMAYVEIREKRRARQ